GTSARPNGAPTGRPSDSRGTVMSEHHATIVWARRSADFTYMTYNREHDWRFKGGVVVEASAAPQYRGSANHPDPEDAFVASLSSCHMLTFLAIAAKRG